MIRPNLLLATLFTVSAAAQAEPATGPRSFVPPDHRCEVVLELGALRDTDLYDDLLSAPLIAMMLRHLESEVLGFSLEHLDRVRMYPELPGARRRPAGQRTGGLMVLQGTDKLALPSIRPGRTAISIGGLDAVVEGDSPDPDLWVDVEPGLLLFGTRHLVAPLLDGSAKPAAAVRAELQAVAAGEQLLLKAALLTSRAMFGGEEGPLSEGDLAAPDLAAVMLRRQQIDDEDQFVLEVVCRFEDSEQGPGALVAVAQTQRQGLVGTPSLAPLKTLLEKIQVEVRGHDAVARIRFGSSREVVAAIGALTPMMLRAVPVPPAGRGR